MQRMPPNIHKTEKVFTSFVGNNSLVSREIGKVEASHFGGNRVNRDLSRHQLPKKVDNRKSKKHKSNTCEYWSQPGSYGPGTPKPTSPVAGSLSRDCSLNQRKSGN